VASAALPAAAAALSPGIPPRIAAATAPESPSRIPSPKPIKGDPPALPGWQ